MSGGIARSGLFAPTVVLGFDPGIAGAYAVLDSNGQCLVEDLPVFSTKTGTGKTSKTRNDLDPVQLAQVLGSFGAAIDHAFIERVSARPGQGVTSMFRFGYAAGTLHGVLAALQIPTTFVTPQAWQKAMRVAASPDAARQRASALFPKISPRLTAKVHQHRADALLIARWGMAHLTGTLAQIDA